MAGYLGDATMPTGRARLILAAALTFTGAYPLLAACDQWALVVNGDGLLFVSIINNGDGHGGFRVRARESDGTTRIMDMPTSGSLSLGVFAAGPLELTLLPPQGCSVTAPNPRTLSVSAGDPLNVGFEVHCS
jgi:hypothetical protein